MKTIVAIHWNDQVVRLASASIDSGIRVEGIESVPLPPNAEPGQVKELIGKLVAQHQARGSDAIVVIDRDQIEIRQFELPPAPEEELPDMVRFQAKNHFSSFTDANIVDFIRIGDGGENAPIQLLVATITASELSQLQSTLDETRLRLKHVLPRPFAVVNLIQSVLANARYQMLINEIGSEADLTITHRNRILLTRTVRLPAAETEKADTLVKEIRRTLAVLRNQQKGAAVEKYIVLGDAQTHAVLAATIDRELGAPAEVLRTADFVSLSPKAAEALANDDGSLGPLLGSLSVSTGPLPHLIDFLLPRKRPEVKRDPRKLIYAGSAVAAMMLLVLAIAGALIWQRRSEVSRLNEQLAALEQRTKDAATVIADVGLVDRWQQADVNWLDELFEISQRFPMPDDAIVNSLSGAIRSTPFEATISIGGLISERKVEDEMVQSLRERPFAITMGPLSPVADNSNYRRSFNHTLTLNLESRQVDDLLFPPKPSLKEPVADQPGAETTTPAANKEPTPESKPE